MTYELKVTHCGFELKSASVNELSDLLKRSDTVKDKGMYVTKARCPSCKGTFELPWQRDLKEESMQNW